MLLGGAKARIGMMSPLASPLQRAVLKKATPNVTRTVAASNPQASPTRAGLVPGSAPLYASALTPVLKAPPPQLVTPEEPSMSLLGRIGGAIKGAVGGFVTGGPAGALGGAALGAISSGGSRRPTVGSQVMVGAGTSAMSSLATPGGPCPPGSLRIPPFIGPCVNTPGGPVTGGGVTLSYGEAVSARYGSALVPATRSLTVRRCPRGAVLGNDGYCYNRSSLNKRDRMWIPGRKPLLTGGELNAITKAHRAATKIKAQTKRLQALGMLAKPKARGRGPARPMHQLAPGITVVDT